MARLPPIPLPDWIEKACRDANVRELNLSFNGGGDEAHVEADLTDHAFQDAEEVVFLTAKRRFLSRQEFISDIERWALSHYRFFGGDSPDDYGTYITYDFARNRVTAMDWRKETNYSPTEQFDLGCKPIAEEVVVVPPRIEVDGVREIKVEEEEEE